MSSLYWKDSQGRLKTDEWRLRWEETTLCMSSSWVKGSDLTGNRIKVSNLCFNVQSRDHTRERSPRSKHDSKVTGKRTWSWKGLQNKRGNDTSESKYQVLPGRYWWRWRVWPQGHCVRMAHIIAEVSYTVKQAPAALRVIQFVSRHTNWWKMLTVAACSRRHKYSSSFVWRAAFWLRLDHKTKIKAVWVCYLDRFVRFSAPLLQLGEKSAANGCRGANKSVLRWDAIDTHTDAVRLRRCTDLCLLSFVILTAGEQRVCPVPQEIRPPRYKRTVLQLFGASVVVHAAPPGPHG